MPNIKDDDIVVYLANNQCIGVSFVDLVQLECLNLHCFQWTPIICSN